MDDIAVLIPCYNEAQTIRKVVTDWRKELPEAVIYEAYIPYDFIKACTSAFI